MTIQSPSAEHMTVRNPGEAAEIVLPSSTDPETLKRRLKTQKEVRARRTS